MLVRASREEVGCADTLPFLSQLAPPFLACGEYLPAQNTLAPPVDFPFPIQSRAETPSRPPQARSTPPLYQAHKGSRTYPHAANLIASILPPLLSFCLVAVAHHPNDKQLPRCRVAVSLRRGMILRPCLTQSQWHKPAQVRAAGRANRRVAPKPVRIPSSPVDTFSEQNNFEPQPDGREPYSETSKAICPGIATKVRCRHDS